jgi:hypothetical protein
LDGNALAGLQGQMVERGGPGSNKSKNVRIKQGTYPLAVHVGPSYRTFKWKENHSYRRLAWKAPIHAMEF